MNTCVCINHKDHGRNVFCAFRFGFTVNTFKFMINHEIESFISGMSGMTESNFMSRTTALSSVVKPIVKKSKYTYERYKLLKKNTVTIYLILIMIISFSSNI